MPAHFLPENTVPDDAENQAIYQSLSRLAGVDRPALIFRTIAATPGALPWCWRRIGPLYQRGQVQDAGWKIAPAMELAPECQFPEEALMLLGIDQPARQKAERVLDVYNRVNPCNLIAIGVLGLILGSASQRRRNNVPAPAPAEEWVPPPAIVPITTMLAPQDIPDTTARLIQEISLDQSAPGEPRLFPSLYRHLADIPGFLPVASILLQPLIRRGQLDLFVRQVRESALRESARLAETIDCPDKDELPDRDRIRVLLERFSWKIPEMIVVGEILRRALPEPAGKLRNQ